MPGTGKPGSETMPAGDPVVDKVRFLLQQGQMVVKGREIHDGIDTWAVSLKADVGRPVWTLWVSAADGKPVELLDPGRDAASSRSHPLAVLRGAAGSGADRLLTLTGAHPTARVVQTRPRSPRPAAPAPARADRRRPVDGRSAGRRREPGGPDRPAEQ